MEQTGFFVIHIGEEGKELEPKAGAPVTPGEQSSYSVRLGWIEGVPYIADLGSAGRILVNRDPTEPNTPYIIRPGDTITIGNTHLTWNTGTEADRSIREPKVAQAEVATSPRPLPPRPAPTYRLMVQTPEWTKEIPLREKLIRIGRSSDNDIHIAAEHVSRHHAQLVKHADGYEIVDLGSENGLTFQNSRFSRRMLADGDVVWISRSISLSFRATEPAAEGDVVLLGLEALPKDQAADETLVTPKRTPSPIETKAPKETIVLPREGTQPPGPGTPARPAVPSGESDDLAQDQAADETLLVPKRSAESVTAQTPEETLLVPRRAAEPPGPSAPPELLKSSAKSGRPLEHQDTDETLFVQRRVTEQSRAVVSDATVIKPERAATPPAPETLDDESVALEEAAGGFDVIATQGTELVDMAQLLEEDADLAFETTPTTRGTRVPHMVIHLPNRTWEVLLTKERLTIGRGEENDVTIPDRLVSRLHAWIEPHGDGYLIREAQSRNGVWLGKRRVQEHTLRDGDILSVGRAKLIFKGGFTSDELTLIGRPRIDGKSVRRPVVFVPGLMGSELWLGSERLWPDPKTLISNTEIFRLPGDPRIEARGIVSDVVIVPNIIKLRQYSGLGDYLETGLGYTRGKDFLEFAYDWRQDVRLAAQRLAEAIENWHVDAPVTIIGHSLGTLVTRYYVERLGGKRFVERIILMGGPHYGTPKGLAAILIGPGMLPFGMGDERMRNVLATFPSAYQILPIYPCVIDQDGTYVDALKDDSWLPEPQRPFLRAARSFRRELGNLSSVPCVSIFGYGLETILRVEIHRRPDGQWQKVDFVGDVAGDTSVPSGSAVLKDSEIHPVLQEHGSLYVDDDVRMRLKVELTRSTTWQRRKQS